MLLSNKETDSDAIYGNRRGFLKQKIHKHEGDNHLI